MPLTIERIEAGISGNVLNLHGLSINDNDVSLICDFLKDKPHITTLNLSRNNIAVAGAQQLARNQTLTTLNIAMNNIRDKGAYALASNQTITNLDVSSCNIGERGAQALACNPIIITLNIGFNHIKNAGVQALVKNNIITSLNIACNELETESAYDCAGNQTITDLNVSGNRFRAEGAQVLASNQTITTLDISRNYIGVSGAMALVSNNKSIAKIILDIDDYPPQSFIDAIEENTTLVEMHFLYKHFLDKNFLNRINNVIYRNKYNKSVKEIMLARLLFQSQRSWSNSVNDDEENKDICYLGRLPCEMLEIIASHTIKDFNPARYRFFANYAAAREKADFEFLRQNFEKLPY
ncbi:leucine-rich repeat domain-containing protein [Legionella clemsonensis]|uniref:Leucine Rich repeats (2 copies) n=1 Tax=Legionella clemsonensis TaxID=1867846 RepID=A0A222P2U4_9GAMM|nr:hypothetical protein [Legionella clemsonensis]ASQ46170.1 Leucine Rich repeats (2 copies) [Legionella clemsonensis]